MIRKSPSQLGGTEPWRGNWTKAFLVCRELDPSKSYCRVRAPFSFFHYSFVCFFATGEIFWTLSPLNNVPKEEDRSGFHRLWRSLCAQCLPLWLFEIRWRSAGMNKPNLPNRLPGRRWCSALQKVKVWMHGVPLLSWFGLNCKEAVRLAKSYGSGMHSVT